MKKTAKITAISACLLLAAGVTFGICLMASKKDNKDNQELKPADPTIAPIYEPEPDPVAVSAEMKVLFEGTTFWGRRTNAKARASELGVAYPFSQLDTLHREDYDAWIAGLECPVTNNGHDDYKEENLFEFNCDPDYLTEAKKYFTAFLLGNNHTDNQGSEGFAETHEHLQENGIQYFGSYDYSDGTNNCGIISLPLRVTLDNGETEDHEIPMGFCSAHGVYGIPVEAARANMGKYAEIVPTVAMPHMGAEYQATADELRMNLYHDMIDRGVEAVIADHPHWTQNAEAYNGRLIVYSMGNFMFDQNGMETARSAAIEADISVKTDGVDFEAWDKLAKTCKEKNGECYDDIATANLPKLELTWKYDYHGTTTDPNSLIPRAATEAEDAAIGERLNWGSIPAELKK